MNKNNQLEFYDFIKRSFGSLNPANDFIDNWHLELIAHKLEQVTKGNIKRLIINMPPRYLKSTCISVAWPAWLLGNNPGRRIIVASYSQALSLKLSIDTKLITQADWYKNFFPNFVIAKGQNEKRKFITTENGHRFATSTGGTLTGFGGNFLIVDDPQNPTKIFSRNYRKSTIDWFEHTFLSRLDDRKNGAIVIVMQRLHEDDLTGYLLKNKAKNWNHLSLAAIAPTTIIYCMGNKKIIRKENEPLNKLQADIKELQQIKEELGDYAFSSQYQQMPISKNSSLFKEVWLKNYDSLPNDLLNIYLSWDTAIKAKENNDYSVCTVWGVTNNQYYLLDVTKEKLEYPELSKLFVKLAEKWQPQLILVEDKASGQSLIQDMQKESLYPIIAIKPKQDKLTRFAASTALFEAGKVNIPRFAKWRLDYIQELTNFPNHNNDDLVDSTSQFLNFIKTRKLTANSRKLVSNL